MYKVAFYLLFGVALDLNCRNTKGKTFVIANPQYFRKKDIIEGAEVEVNRYLKTKLKKLVKTKEPKTGKTRKTSTKSPKSSKPQCIPDPYPKSDIFEDNLEETINCMRQGLGNPGGNNSTQGIWYSINHNDNNTMNLNSQVPWGFTDPPNLPAIIVRPLNEDQVGIALSCSVNNGMRIVPWSKGHNWANLSSIDNYILIRLDNICNAKVNHDKKTMTISAGCAVGHQIGKLRLFGEDEVDKRLLLNFGCPNIGIGGSFAGGGQGYSSGFLGMQIDTVTKVRYMIYNKKGEIKIVEASNSEKKYKDLFWAARGGMGGYGIILDITLQSIPTPSEDGSVTWVDLLFKESGRGSAMFRFQQLILKNERFGIAQTMSFDAKGARLRLSYLGPADQAVGILIDAGLIDNEILDTNGDFRLTPEKSIYFKDYSEVCSGSTCVNYKLPPKGVQVFNFPSYRQFTAAAWFNPITVNQASVCDATQYGFDCGDGTTDLQYHFISQRENILRILEMAEDAKSGLLNPTSNFWNLIPKGILDVPGHQWRLSEDGWNALAELRTTLKDCPGNLVFTHATGGKSAKVSQYDTAYPWRGYPLLSFFLGQPKATECASFLSQISDLRVKYAAKGFGRSGAYINYPGDPDNCCNAAKGQDWTDLYYGHNYEKLSELRDKYDPYNIYSKPQIPEPKEGCAL